MWAKLLFFYVGNKHSQKTKSLKKEYLVFMQMFIAIQSGSQMKKTHREGELYPNRTLYKCFHRIYEWVDVFI